MIEIHIDGACKDNHIKNVTRRASICIIVQQDGIVIVNDIGNKTNNQAEWEALVEALKLAQKNNWNNIKIFSDSKLVVEQFNNRWRVKKQELMSYYFTAKTLEGLIDTVDLRWISRSQNLAGIELERRT